MKILVYSVSNISNGDLFLKYLMFHSLCKKSNNVPSFLHPVISSFYNVCKKWIMWGIQGLESLLGCELGQPKCCPCRVADDCHWFINWFFKHIAIYYQTLSTYDTENIKLSLCVCSSSSYLGCGCKRKCYNVHFV